MSAASAPGKIEHIVFGTDSSESAERAVAWVKDIAKLRGASVAVVCAFDSPKAFRKRGSVYLAEARDEFEQEAREIVAEVVAELQTAGIESTGIAYEGSPADAILGTADSEEADIIIVGRGGQQGVRDYLMGSVAERVIRHARVPVFVVS